MMDAKPEDAESAGVADFEREMLRIAASATEGRGLKLSLARLVPVRL